MNSVFNVEDDIAGQAGILPTENFQFAYANITEAVKNVKNGSTGVSSVSWDQVHHVTGTAANLPAGVSLVALTAPAAPPITLTLTPSTGDKTPVTIVLGSYLFNADKPVILSPASAGAGAGKVKLDELVVDAPFSDGSLAIFQALTTGTRFDAAVLTQNDASGHQIASWTLNTVYVTSEKINGGNNSEGPTEEVHLAYNAETEATGGTSAAWNQVTNKGTFGAVPPGIAAASVMPAPITLQLTPATGNTAPFTIAVQSYAMGTESTVKIGSPGVGITEGKAKFEDLIIQAEFGPNSPRLFQATAAGTRFTSAVLSQNDSNGIPVAVWTFNLVFASSDTISGTGADLPTESVHFVFGSETVTTKAQTASYDAVRNQFGALRANLNGSAVGPIPSTGTSTVTLQLTPAVGTPGTSLTIPLNTYQFGFMNNAPIGWAGASSTKTAFTELDATTVFGSYSAQLFATLVAGGHFSTATLTQNDSAGHTIAVWTLNSLFITQDKFEGAAGDLAPTETLHFVFRGVTERTGTSAAAWDQVSNVSPTPAPLPPNVTVAPITAPSSPSITLELIPRGISPTPITIAVNDFDFLFQKPLTLTSGAVGGVKAGKTALDNLTIDTFFGNDSPKILAMLAKGDHYASAVLVQRNAAGKAIASWTLNTVFITADTVHGDVEGVPTETIKFAFNGINEATSAIAGSWDQVHDKAGTINSLLDSNNLVPIDGGSPPIGG